MTQKTLNPLPFTPSFPHSLFPLPILTSKTSTTPPPLLQTDSPLKAGEKLAFPGLLALLLLLVPGARLRDHHPDKVDHALLLANILGTHAELE